MIYKSLEDLLYNAPSLYPMKTLIDNDVVFIMIGDEIIYENHPTDILIELLNWVSLNPEMV
jgi:hypothetical protein